jgi:hypothetical protein
MPKYKIYTKIESNAPASNLFYDLTVYRMKNGKERYELLSVDKEPLGNNYLTQQHETNDTDDDSSIIYLMDIMLYRLHGGELHQAIAAPFTKMFTLGEMVSGRAYTNNKRDNICYFETTHKTKPTNDNGEDHLHIIKMTCKERVYVSLEHPVGDPLDPFEIEVIEEQLEARKAASILKPEGKNYPNQYYSMLCGPAAFFYCLMLDRFDVYQKLIWDLWNNGIGKLGLLVIKPSNKTMKVKDLFGGMNHPRVSAIDWITMASLRDSSNKLLNYDSIEDKVSAITLWGDIEHWMVSIGAKKIFDNISISQSRKIDICNLNESSSENTHTICLISAGMLQQGADVPFKDHWIVWDGKLTSANGNEVTLETSLEDVVNLRLFSWGELRDNWLRESLTFGDFLRYSFGGMVFTKIP